MRKSRNIIIRVFLKSSVILLHTLISISFFSASAVLSKSSAITQQPRAPEEFSLSIWGLSALLFGSLGISYNRIKKEQINSFKTLIEKDKNGQLQIEDLQNKADDVQSKLYYQNEKNKLLVDIFEQENNQLQSTLNPIDQELKNLQQQIHTTFFEEEKDKKEEVIRLIREMENKVQIWQNIHEILPDKAISEQDIAEMDENIKEYAKFREKFDQISSGLGADAPLKDKIAKAQENVQLYEKLQQEIVTLQIQMDGFFENHKKQILKIKKENLKQQISSVDEIKDPEEMKQEVEESRKGAVPPVIIHKENNVEESEEHLRRTRNDKTPMIKEENRKEERLEISQKHPEEQEKPAFEHPDYSALKKGNSSKTPHENSEHSHSNNIHEK